MVASHQKINNQRYVINKARQFLSLLIGRASFEKALFVLFLLVLPLQVRFYLRDVGGLAHNEWTQVWIWASDIALFLFVVAAAAVLRPHIVRPRMATIFLFGFAAWSVASSALALHPPLAIWTVVKLIEMLVLFFVLRGARERISPRFLFVPLAAGAVIEACIALVQFFLQGAVGLGTFGESPLAISAAGVAKFSSQGVLLLRAYGLEPHPNILAAFLVVGLLSLLWLFITSSPEVKTLRQRVTVLVMSMALFVLVLGIAVTFSRTVWVLGSAACVSFFFLVFLHPALRKEFGKRALFAAVVTALSIGIAVILFWPEVSSRVTIEPHEQAVSLRNFYNRFAVEALRHTPLLGLGPGNFVEHLASPGDVTGFQLVDWLLQPVHNIYLLIASEAGAPALFLFLLFLGGLFWQWIERVSKAIGSQRLAHYVVFCGVITMLGAGFYDHFPWTLQQGRLLLWLFLGFL